MNLDASTLDALILRRGNLIGLAGLRVRITPTGEEAGIASAERDGAGRYRIGLGDGSRWDASALVLLDPWPSPAPPRPNPPDPAVPWSRYRRPAVPRPVAIESPASTPPGRMGDSSSPPA